MWGRRAHARTAFPLLVARNRRLAWDARRVRDAGGPILCEVSTNVLWGLARLAMGEPSVTSALVDRLWDERRGLFLDEAQPGGLRPAVETWAALMPGLPIPQGTDYLPLAVGGVLITLFSLEKLVRLILAGWMLWIGLVRLGYADEAAQMARRLGEAVLSQGLREYYHPSTGEGLGATDFAWTSLILEMVDPASGAAASYLREAQA